MNKNSLEYMSYLMGLLLTDIEVMIDVEVLTFEEFVNKEVEYETK